MKIKSEYKENNSDYSGAMTDISFLLIIFFLIAAVFMTEYGMDLTSPGTEPETIKKNEVIYIDITGPGSYIINSEAIEENYLGFVISEKLKNSDIIIINANTGIKYQQVLSVIETARLSGGSSFSITFKNENPVPIKITGEL